MQQNHCPGGRGLCAEILDQSNFLKEGAINGELLLKFLYQVSFDGASADRIEFDKNGDVKGSYKIVNLQKDTNGWTELVQKNKACHYNSTKTFSGSIALMVAMSQFPFAVNHVVKGSTGSLQQTSQNAVGLAGSVKVLAKSAME